MSRFVNEIYKVPLMFECNNNLTVANLRYKGKNYVGCAFLHPDDVEFASKRVGKHIAAIRARISCLEDVLVTQKEILAERERFFNEVKMHRELEEVDPKGYFRRVLKQQRTRIIALSTALSKEKAGLKEYIKGQNNVIASVTRYRNKVKGI